MGNKYQEALDLLKCNSEQYIANHSSADNIQGRFKESDDASRSLQELVDKATPIKPKIDEELNVYGDKQGECPICEQYIEEQHSYCLNCGQALLWEER